MGSESTTQMNLGENADGEARQQHKYAHHVHFSLHYARCCAKKTAGECYEWA